MTDALTRLTNLRSEVEAKHAEMKQAAQEAVKDGTKAIFAEYGDILEKFGWTQYTPYFNDGEPCVFDMHELVLVEKDAPESVDDEWPYESAGAFSDYSDHSKVSARYAPDKLDEHYVNCKAACNQVYEALAFGDLAKDVFGDHVLVTFTPEGVDVDDQDHE